MCNDLHPYHTYKYSKYTLKLFMYIQHSGHTNSTYMKIVGSCVAEKIGYYTYKIFCQDRILYIKQKLLPFVPCLEIISPINAIENKIAKVEENKCKMIYLRCTDQKKI